jgi:hypothetical protein
MDDDIEIIRYLPPEPPKEQIFAWGVIRTEAMTQAQYATFMEWFNAPVAPDHGKG